MSRLVRELELLTEMSLQLQSGIHTLDLSQSTPHTRKVLQSADRLSQTLMCVKIAMERARDAGSVRRTPGFHGNLEGVFLQEVRERLLYGERLAAGDNDQTDGAVDIF